MDNNVTLRLLKDSINDYILIHRWYHNPKVNTYFEQRILSYDEVVAKYSKRTTLNSTIPVYIIEYRDIPIGIIQYTKLTNELKQKYHIIKDGYDIDIFIGEEDYYHKGIGSLAIKLLINSLKTEDIVFIMVPEVTNTNAINCYEKVGFKKTIYIKDTDTIGNLKEKIVMVYE